MFSSLLSGQVLVASLALQFVSAAPSGDISFLYKRQSNSTDPEPVNNQENNSGFLTSNAAPKGILPQNPKSAGNEKGFCVPTQNPADNWNQGVGDYLNEYLTKNDNKNWLSNLDRQTTANGLAQPALLNCEFVSQDTCAPTLECTSFTPPEVFFIRQAASNLHTLFQEAARSVSLDIVSQGFSVDTIIKDMVSDPLQKQLQGSFAAVSSSYGIISGLLGFGTFVGGPIGATLGAVSGLAGAIGGSFGLASGVLGLTAPDTEAYRVKLNEDLRSSLNQATDKIEKFLLRIMAGPVSGADTFGLTEFSNALGSQSDPSVINDIARVFEGGRFLGHLEQKDLDAFKTAITQGLGIWRQQTVGQILKGSNYYVFIDTNKDQSTCTATGSRWIDSQCHQLSKRHLDENDPDFDTEPLDASIVGKLDDSTYQIDLEKFYRNALDCQNAHQDFSGTLDTTKIPDANGLPQCFFNVPVIQGAGGICDQVLVQGRDLPSGIATRETCFSKTEDPSLCSGSGVRGKNC